MPDRASVSQQALALIHVTASAALLEFVHARTISRASDARVARPDAVGHAEHPADRFMRSLLRVSERNPRATVSAHRAFRLSLVSSGVRCLATYLVVPIVVPVVNLAAVVAAPIGILLCLVAVVSGIAGVRRFWRADHRSKWMYTWFMAAVFIVLGIALVADISRLVA